MGSDHPSNTKRNGAAIYNKDLVAVIGRNDISSLNESLDLKIPLTKNICFLTGLYRPPSQNKDQFGEVC